MRRRTLYRARPALKSEKGPPHDRRKDETDERDETDEEAPGGHQVDLSHVQGLDGGLKTLMRTTS